MQGELISWAGKKENQPKSAASTSAGLLWPACLRQQVLHQVPLAWDGK